MKSATPIYSGLLISAFAALITGCSHDGGGGGGGGGGATAQSCTYQVPSTDLSSLTSTDQGLLIGYLNNGVYTADNRFATLIEEPAGSAFNAEIWDGSKWLQEPIISSNVYSTYYLPKTLTTFGSQLALMFAGGGGPSALPFLSRLYLESSGAFQPPVDMTGVPTGNSFVPNWASGYNALGKFSVGSYTNFGGTVVIDFAENTTADAFTAWTAQTVISSATTTPIPIKSGYFTDNTAYSLFFTNNAAVTGGTISLYRRTGVSWASLLNVTTFGPSTLGSEINSPVALEDPTHQSLYVFWVEYTNHSGPNPNVIVVRAATVNLSTMTATTPVTLTTINNPTFANPVSIFPDFFPNSTNGVYAVQDTDSGTAYLGSFSGTVFSAAQPYRPDLAFTSGFNMKIMNCSQPVVMAGVAPNPTLFVNVPTPSQYGM